MSTYSRKTSRAYTFFAVLGIFLFTVCLFVGIFWWYGRDYAKISLERTYYFLVRDCEDTTASAVSGQVYLSGGAGYLLEMEGESVVVLSCYFKLTDGERVQSIMEGKGIETRLISLKAEDFTLKDEDAEFKKKVSENIETVETCAKMLYESANGLERNDITQDHARATVKGVVSSLKGLQTGNTEKFFLPWNAELSFAEKRGRELAEGILFAKDLRYLQVQLLLNIIHANEYFA